MNSIFDLSSSNGWDIRKIPEEERTYDICLEAVKFSKPRFGYNRYVLSFVPLKYRQYELCYISVSNVGRSIEEVPTTVRDIRMYKAALLSDGEALGDVPHELINMELCLCAVQQTGEAILFVPAKLMTKDMVITAMKTAARLFYILPDEFKNDYDVCYTACKYNKDNLCLIPDSIQDLLMLR